MKSLSDYRRLVPALVMLLAFAGAIGTGCAGRSSRPPVPSSVPVDRSAFPAPSPQPNTSFQSDRILWGYLDPNRDPWQQPERVIRAMGLAPGQTIADIGTASGYFAWHFSPVVGARGTVWAVDIDPNAISFVRRRLEKDPPACSNIRPVLSRPDSITLAGESLDWGFLGEAHFFLGPINPDSAPCLDSIHQALKPGGRVAVLEFRNNENLGVVEPARIKAPFEKAGFRVVAIHDFLPQEHFLIFEKPTR